MFVKLILAAVVFVSMIANVEAKKKKEYKTYTVPIEVLTEGEGELIPKGANVTCHMTMYTDDGALIWSS